MDDNRTVDRLPSNQAPPRSEQERRTDLSATGHSGSPRTARLSDTVIITNNRTGTVKQIIERYARRMTIEQRLAESIRSFHVDALTGSVPLNIDLDVALSVLANTVCASLRRRLTGYHHATPDTLQRRFLSTGGIILNHDHTIVVRLNRRTYSPVLRQADIPQVAVPWWGGRTLRFEYD